MLPGIVDRTRHDEIVAWIAAHVSWSCGSSNGNRLETFVEGPRPIPAWGEALGREMLAAGIFDVAPNYLHLIEYRAGSGITPHMDREELGEVVAGLTLGSSRVFEFRRKHGPAVARVLLHPGDLYVLAGPARRRWLHGVPFVPVDEFGGRTHARTDGISASWRSFPEGSTWISEYARG